MKVCRETNSKNPDIDTYLNPGDEITYFITDPTGKQDLNTQSLLDIVAEYLGKNLQDLQDGSHHYEITIRNLG